MPLAAGQSLSFYEILGPLGAGAMGEVYHARDSRLDREVAIKVLPENFAQDAERLRRFEREARSLASLNHPNVAQVYGIDEVEGTCFMAMELVPGEDLAKRLSSGALPVPEALDVCRQIADGVEAAHEAGVIHRDLKPANVLITPEGKVKVLDFGLAKPGNASAEGSAAADSVLATEEGRLLGTPTYMSPEQARGKAVCRRADVWAFGCVLFECLTAKRAFGGRGVAKTLAAVLEREWDRRALPAATPPHVRTLLERCLDKDPRQRLRDIGEARICLERGPDASQETRPGGVLKAGILVLVALGIGALAGRFLAPAQPASVAPAIQLRRLTERAGMEVTPAVSPDERTLAFIALSDGRRHVFLRRMGGGSPKQITQGEFDHSFPRWVDEDTLLYYRLPLEGESRGSLWLAPILSASAPEFVAVADGEADVSRFGRIATVRKEADGSEAMVVMDLEGRVLRSLKLPPRIFTFYRSPRWSPDGRSVAFTAQVSLALGEIQVVDLDRGEPVVYHTPPGRTRGLAWLPDGSGLVFASSSGSTMAYPPLYVLRLLRLGDGKDEPLPTTDSEYVSYVEPDVTPSGKLVASRIRMESDVYRFPVDGDPLDNVRRAERITFQTGMVQVPSASPDGEQVAYLSDSGGNANIWIADIHGSTPRRVTDEQDPEATIAIPNWSPRGDRIVFYRTSPDRGAEQWLVHTDPKDQGKDGPLCPTAGGATWTQDGEWIYQIAPDPTGAKGMIPATQKVHVDSGETIHVRDEAVNLLINSDETVCYFFAAAGQEGEVYKASPPDTGESELLIGGLQSRIPLWPHHYTLSPDDAWLATPLKDQDTTNLFLISTETGELTQVTDFGDRATLIARQVSWSGDGRWLYAAVMDTDADVVLLDGALE